MDGRTVEGVESGGWRGRGKAGLMERRGEDRSANKYEVWEENQHWNEVN